MEHPSRMLHCGLPDNLQYTAPQVTRVLPYLWGGVMFIIINREDLSKGQQYVPYSNKTQHIVAQARQQLSRQVQFLTSLQP